MSDDLASMTDDELVAEHQALDERVMVTRARMGELHDEMERRRAAAVDLERFGEHSATAEAQAAAEHPEPAPAEQTIDVPAMESTEEVGL